MRVTQHGSYLVEMTRFARLFPVSSYLVIEDDGLTLIDTGLSRSGQSFIDAARDVGQPIVRVALTHAHSDHAGSYDELHRLLPEAEFLVSEREARLMAGDTRLDPGEPQVELRGGVVTSDFRPTRLLNAGDRVGSLEVIPAPGHTPGQIAFLDHRDRTLIAGDAFYTRGGIAVAGTMRLVLPFPALATWHKPTALESARRLRDLNPSLLVVGHGKALQSPVPQMDKAIAEMERSLSKRGAPSR
ncbi:MBL fold metallo-hydrolase [soil metagenome]